MSAVTSSESLALPHTEAAENCPPIAPAVRPLHICVVHQRETPLPREAVWEPREDSVCAVCNVRRWTCCWSLSAPVSQQPGLSLGRTRTRHWIVCPEARTVIPVANQGTSCWGRALLPSKARVPGQSWFSGLELPTPPELFGAEGRSHGGAAPRPERGGHSFRGTQRGGPGASHVFTSINCVDSHWSQAGDLLPPLFCWVSCLPGKVPEAAEGLAVVTPCRVLSVSAPGTSESSLGVPLAAVQRPGRQSSILPLPEESQRGSREQRKHLAESEPPVSTEAASVLPSQLSAGHCVGCRDQRASCWPSQWEAEGLHALPSRSRPPGQSRRGAQPTVFLQLSLPTLLGSQRRVGCLCSRSARVALGQGAEDSLWNCACSRVRSGVNVCAVYRVRCR